MVGHVKRSRAVIGKRQATFGRFVRRHRPLLAGFKGCPRPVVIGRCGQEGSPGTGLAAGPARREGKLGEAGGCLLAVWLAWPLEGCWQLLAACSSHLMLLVRPACFSTASLALLGPQSTSLSSKAPLSPPNPLTTVLNLVFDHPVFAVELPSPRSIHAPNSSPPHR